MALLILLMSALFVLHRADLNFMVEGAHAPSGLLTADEVDVGTNVQALPAIFAPVF